MRAPLTGLALLSAGACAGLPCAGDGPLPFDWPEPDAGGGPFRWDLPALAPVSALVRARLEVGPSGDPAIEREDEWIFDLAGPAEGSIRHEMRYRGPYVAERVVREDAVRKAGRLASRRGGGEYLAHADDGLWDGWLVRTGLDFAGLMREAGLPAPARADGPAPRFVSAANGARAEVVADARGLVVGATLEAEGAGWQVRFELSVEPAAAPAPVPDVDAARPERDQPVPRLRRLLDAGGAGG